MGGDARLFYCFDNAGVSLGSDFAADSSRLSVDLSKADADAIHPRADLRPGTVIRRMTLERL